MIKINNNSDKLIISHIADIDGMGSVILSKAIGNFDICLVEITEVASELEELINNNKYKEIYMCDLSMQDDMAKKIDDKKVQIKLFDHHQTAIGLNKYSWATVVPEKEGFRPSGTSLFYEYLLENTNNKIIHSDCTKEFVEAIRSYDVWDWIKDGNVLGRDLTIIFSMIGPERFIDKYYNRLVEKNNSFELNSFEKELLDIKLLEMNDYIKKCDENLIRTKFYGYNIGLSISETYRSEVGSELSKKYPELDFILIVKFMRKSCSLRTTTDINVGKIAEKFGGGGHPKSASFPLNNKNLKIILKIIKKNLNKV